MSEYKDINETPADANTLPVQEANEAAATPEEEKEYIPSMDEFKDELERSFKKVKEGDILTGNRYRYQRI